MQNQLDPIAEVVEAEVVDTNEATKTIMLLNDSTQFVPHSTTARTVSDLMSELGLQGENVVARAAGSDILDFSSTEVHDTEFYSFFTRNKTGG